MTVKLSKKYIKFREERSKTLKQMKKKFFDTVAENLHHKSSYEVIFSFQFLKSLREILPTPDAFLEMTLEARRKVSETINNLALIESDWKTIVSKISYEHKLILKMFPVESKKFRKGFDNYFRPKKNITHLQIIEKYPHSKTKAFCKGLFRYLQNKKIPFLKNFPYDKIDDKKLELISTFVANNVDSDYFFKEILKICMKKAHDNRINVEAAVSQYRTQPLNNPFLFVKRTHIMYPLQTSIVLYLSVAFLEALKNELEKEEIFFELKIDNNILLFLSDFLKNNEEYLMQSPKKGLKTEWYRDTYNIAIFFISLFADSGIVVAEETLKTDKSDKHKNVVYWLKHELENTVPFSHHIPRIIPPKKITSKSNIKPFMSPYSKGEFSMSPSKLTIKALNLAQSKVFKINEIYENFLDNTQNVPGFLQTIFHNKIQEKGNTTFPTVGEMACEFNNYIQMKNSLSINALQKYINKKAVFYLYTVIGEKKKDKNVYKRAFVLAGISQLESNLNYKKRLLWLSFLTAKSKRQLLQTSLVISNIFKGYPLYYGTKLDFRTRMYPWEYLLSRTTGELKQLLCDFHAEKLTEDGFLALMTAYYSFSLKISKEWHLLLRLDPSITQETLFERIKEFFNEYNLENNPEDFNLDKKAPYVLTLHAHLVMCFQEKNRGVDVFLEIDQVGSGIMLLSILLGIRPLAEECNVLGNTPKDIYRYLMLHTEKFFEEQVFEKVKSGYEEKLGDNRKFEFTDEKKNEYKTVVSFLSTNRSCVKDILMKWVYSQGKLNRRRDIIGFFRECYGRSASEFEFKLIQVFSNMYDRFLTTMFPKIETQKKLMAQALDVRLNAGSIIQGINLRTVDGSGLSWGIDPVETIEKTVWDPINNKSHNVSIKVKETEQDASKESVKQVKSDYHRGLFPNLIHSIDASIMRLIIYRVWKKTGYVISHLHDCVLCHPNAVSTVYEVITEIYTDGTLDNLAEKTFFIPMQEGLSSDDKAVIENLNKEFKANQDKFNITSENFVAENGYTFEGSVKRSILYTHLKPLEPVKLIHFRVY